MDINMILTENAKVSPNEYSPLALAFMGDAVFETFVRAKVLAEANASANTLHRRAVYFVNCRAQARAIEAFLKMLSDEEEAVYKRGRNAKTFTVPKNADVHEYHAATGFEALLGWLYLTKNEKRACEIMEFAYNFIKNENANR